MKTGHLEGCAREQDAVIALELLQLLEELGLGVLQSVRLVHHQKAPGDARQQTHVLDRYLTHTHTR